MGMGGETCPFPRGLVMDEKDELVIVLLSKDVGIKMLKSEAERQGLKYRRIGEKQYSGEIEFILDFTNKMEYPVEDKGISPDARKRKPKQAGE